MDNLEVKKARVILIVDDDVDCINLVSSALQWEDYSVKSAQNGEVAIKMLEESHPDLVLLDMTMPGISGLEVLEKLRQAEDYVSVMFVSAYSTTDDIIRGLDAGADDYICKPFDPRELVARVRTQIRIKDLNDELRHANKKLKDLVNIDDLTGLFNMRSFYTRLDNELARGRRFGRSVCVVMMDMDNFKNVNDGHDHLFGSYVLSEVGKIIKENIRSIDFAARYGGDEFLVVLTETDDQGAGLFCERLRKKIENHVFTHRKDKTQKTASLGYSVAYPQHKDIDARNLVRLADRALYKAKEQGRNRVVKYELNKGMDSLPNRIEDFDDKDRFKK